MKKICGSAARINEIKEAMNNKYSVIIITILPIISTGRTNFYAITSIGAL